MPTAYTWMIVNSEQTHDILTLYIVASNKHTFARYPYIVLTVNKKVLYLLYSTR